MKKLKILVLPGDGIGPEVVAEAVKVLERVAQIEGLRLEIDRDVAGGASIDQSGIPLTPEVLSKAKKADAVLLGAVGGPAWDQQPPDKRPEQALLGLRKGLKLYANLRPARVFRSLIDSSSLKSSVIEGTDLLMVRELTGGIYFGKPRGIKNPGTEKAKGVNTEVYWATEIQRIVRVAFEMARGRRQKVTSVDKANILETSMLWREVAAQVAPDYPDVQLESMYVDNCAMQLIRNPKQFDVIVTSNLFGDILSDEASMLTGSIGMLPSASLGEKKNRQGFAQGMYEPVHGSAPTITGQGLANPIATVLSCAMMLRHSFGMEPLAVRIEKAVESLLDEGFRTADIFSDGAAEGADRRTKKVGTEEMGGLICERVARQN